MDETPTGVWENQINHTKETTTMKTYTIIIHRRGKERPVTGTIDELIKYFSYTLEVGKSWAHEKGNKAINTAPKTIASLITNINNAESNAARNGNPTNYYTEDK